MIHPEFARYFAACMALVRDDPEDPDGWRIRRASTLAQDMCDEHDRVDAAGPVRVVDDTPPPLFVDADVEEVQRSVCAHFRVRRDDMISHDRHHTLTLARHIAMYLCKRHLRCSYPEIGRAFGGRDHTTVMSAVRKIEAQRETDQEVRAHVDALDPPQRAGVAA